MRVRTFLLMCWFCAVCLALGVARGAAQDLTRKPEAAASQQPQQPQDPYDAYFLAAATVGQESKDGRCKEAASSLPLLGEAGAWHKRRRKFSLVTSPYAADMTGASLQSGAQRADRSSISDFDIAADRFWHTWKSGS